MSVIMVRNSRKAVQMIKARNNRAHRKYHIDRANHLRMQADKWKEDVIASAIQHFGFLPDDVKEKVDTEYNDLMLGAIAEENRKCMDEKH